MYGIHICIGAGAWILGHRVLPELPTDERKAMMIEIRSRGLEE